MARHKNTNWDLPEGSPHHSWVSIHAALLMDIRDELQAINRTLRCQKSLGIPHTLTAILQKLPEPRKRKKS